MPGREQELEAELDAVDADLAHADGAARRRAGLARLPRAHDRDQVQALQAYREHMPASARAPGKYAERFRQAARSGDARGPARGARVGDAAGRGARHDRARAGLFDVVIVDEASQAEPGGPVPAVARAAGDRGRRRQAVRAVRRCASASWSRSSPSSTPYLPDLPAYLRDAFTPRSSLFSICCAPGSARWSGCASTSAACRRSSSTGPGSSTPTSRWCRCASSARDRLRRCGRHGSRARPPRARRPGCATRSRPRRSSRQIEACLADPALRRQDLRRGRAAGHRSGAAAAPDAASSASTRRSGRQRRLRVGTPPDFQGDERDVVFLSLVVRRAARRRDRHRVAAPVQRGGVAGQGPAVAVPLRGRRRADARSTCALPAVATVLNPPPALAAEAAARRRPRRAASRRSITLLEQRVFCASRTRLPRHPAGGGQRRRIDLVVTGGTMGSPSSATATRSRPPRNSGARTSTGSRNSNGPAGRSGGYASRSTTSTRRRPCRVCGDSGQPGHRAARGGPRDRHRGGRRRAGSARRRRVRARKARGPHRRFAPVSTY